MGMNPKIWISPDISAAFDLGPDGTPTGWQAVGTIDSTRMISCLDRFARLRRWDARRRG
jgi:hypothetical protein